MVNFYVCSFKLILIFFSSLINLSASNDVSMHFQGDIEEQYSSVPHFTILHFSICLRVINFKCYQWSLDFFDSIPYRENIKGFRVSWGLFASSNTSPIIQSNYFLDVSSCFHFSSISNFTAWKGWKTTPSTRRPQTFFMRNNPQQSWALKWKKPLKY